MNTVEIPALYGCTGRKIELLFAMKDKYPLLVRVDRSEAKGNQSLISGMMLDTRTKEKRDVQWFCDSPIVVSKETALFPARQVKERNYKLVFRRMGTDKLIEADCKE